MYSYRVAGLALAALMSTAGISVAATDEECASRFTASDANGDGTLSADEGQKTPLSREAFMTKCKSDSAAATVPGTAPEAGATGAATAGKLETGANSFTETQARARIERLGYSDVGPLKKDDAGIWRATAKRDGKTVNVGLDFKGNVAAN